ncbi:expressed unknown protein [Seminavis robusta]|uniref:Uncharacterized protein n=1 Tax=Seminavis robusta TaxID=568900 RepID=A0A9N8DA44_9STRA|nr:expressed unknown protein [Seminavis robusta]|eukprot:Sro31_g020082.1  (191) ;mRNA; f:27378-27950
MLRSLLLSPLTICAKNQRPRLHQSGKPVCNRRHDHLTAISKDTRRQHIKHPTTNQNMAISTTTKATTASEQTVSLAQVRATMRSSTNDNKYWKCWQSRFRKTQACLLADDVCPVEERHMELTPDDADSFRAKQESVKYIRRAVRTSFTARTMRMPRLSLSSPVASSLTHGSCHDIAMMCAMAAQSPFTSV